MDTKEEPALIYEVDGPLVAYFEIWGQDPNSGDEFKLTMNSRICYRSIKWSGADEKSVRGAFDQVMNLIRAELTDICGPLGITPIIWWRKHPRFSFEEDRHRVYARLATSPELPEVVWSQIEVPEGGQYRQVES